MYCTMIGISNLIRIYFYSTLDWNDDREKNKDKALEELLEGYCLRWNYTYLCHSFLDADRYILGILIRDSIWHLSN